MMDAVQGCIPAFVKRPLAFHVVVRIRPATNDGPSLEHLAAGVPELEPSEGQEMVGIEQVAAQQGP